MCKINLESIMKKVVPGLVVSLLVSTSVAQTDSDVAIVKKFIPTKYSQMKSSLTGSTLILEDGLGYIMREAELDGKGKGKYLIVSYQAMPNFETKLCELYVIKVNGTVGTLLGKPSLNAVDGANGCSDLIVGDLDGDSKPEIQLITSTLKGEDNAPMILRWNGSVLQELTPSVARGSRKVSAFRNAVVTTAKDGLSNIILDAPFSSEDADSLFKLYAIKSGKIAGIGSYNWYRLKNKTTTTPSVQTETLSLPAGTYTLEVKNRSADLTKAVRAQVQIGANVIIKPGDLCSGPAPKGYKPPNDGDNNEDKNKGCVPRKNFYTTVTLTGKEVIKVTGYGATGSFLEVSLLKK